MVGARAATLSRARKFLSVTLIGSLELAVIRDKMRNHWLGWFGHLMRLGEEGLFRPIQEFGAEGRQVVGGTKLTRDQVIQADMIVCGIDGVLAEDRRA